MRRRACSTGSGVTTPGCAVADPRRVFSLALLLAVLACPAPANVVQRPPVTFAPLQPGETLGAGWRLITLPGVEPTRFAWVEQAGGRLLRADAAASAASLARAVHRDLGEDARLEWRWRVDRVVARGDVHRPQGDDFAARLYVMFDYPTESLSLLARTRLNIARWLYGQHVPAAALCYVWGNREPLETRAWNAYTDRVRMIVLRNADSGVGDWAVERRDLAADYREAFGGPPPPVAAIAIGADTDQTGETVTAWFGDIHLVE